MPTSAGDLSFVSLEPPSGEDVALLDQPAVRPRRLPWASLLMRSLGVSGLECPRCQSQMVLLAVDYGASDCGENVGSPPHPLHAATVGAGPPGVCAKDVQRRAGSDRPLRRSRIRQLRAHRWDGDSQSASIAGPRARPEPDPSRTGPEPDRTRAGPDPSRTRATIHSQAIASSASPGGRLRWRPPEASTLSRQGPYHALRASIQPHATCSHPPRRPHQAASPPACSAGVIQPPWC